VAGVHDRLDAIAMAVMASRRSSTAELLIARHDAPGLGTGGLYGDRGQVDEATRNLCVLAEVVAGAQPVIAVSDLQRAVEAQLAANEQDR
jgi:hypothetical protein